MTDRYQVIVGDALEQLRALPDNSVDAVVTDPPYGLRFMNHRWDCNVPRAAVWAEALRVLKPGGHLAAFAGTRTQHRMATEIEDAGFEIRDMLAWVYGCLSEDSEVLTEDGWMSYDAAQHRRILAYDVQADVYQWEEPTRWSVYRVDSDTAYHIQSDHTDQIVSRGHRCLVERGGKLVFVAADVLAPVEVMPTLSDDFRVVPETGAGALQPRVQRRRARPGLGDSRVQRPRGVDGREPIERQRKDERTAESGVARWCDAVHAQGEVRESVDPLRALSSEPCADGAPGWLRDGTPADGGARDRASIDPDGMRPSCEPRRDGQPDRESDAVRDELGPQTVRARASYRTTVATVTAIKYSGLIWCPTVSTGAFVARRAGKVFITGNSGFPKSLNISKAIDAAAGAERPVVGDKLDRPGYHLSPNEGHETFGSGVGSHTADERARAAQITAPATEAARQWDGWGTALKPALEPITLARKPIPGTIVDNVLTHGTGALNIDGCRVPFAGEDDEAETKTKGKNRHSDFGSGPMTNRVYGEFSEDRDNYGAVARWPANLIHDGSAEVLNLFPNTSTGIGGGMGMGYHGGDGEANPLRGYGDTGSAARFFYCAKASRAERDFGLDAFPMRTGGELTGREDGSKGTQNPRAGAGRVNGGRNLHPTVKPVALMRWLVRLLTPPGGVVLDPFMGSGSTGIAAMIEGVRFVGVELLDEHAAIARARIEAVIPLVDRGVPFDLETVAEGAAAVHEALEAQPGLF